MWNSSNDWQRQMWCLAGQFPTKIILIIRDSILRCLNISKSDALEAWISIHIIINYSFLHRLNEGNSNWKYITDWCSPFALCILIIHFYSLIKYSPSGAIYMRILITTFLFPGFDILPNIVMAFLLQTSVSIGNRRLFQDLSSFICDNNNNDNLMDKKCKIICSHYYLMNLYEITKEMYRTNYLHLYNYRKIHCNYYQNNFIEKLTPFIKKEIENNLTSKISSNLNLSSISISNWTYLWHIVLGYDKFWIVNYYQKSWCYILIRFIYIIMLIFGCIQYITKLFDFISVLKDFKTNSFDKDCIIIFILLGEFWTFGYCVYYIRKKDSDRFIVRLYQQRFVERVFDAIQISNNYLNNKTLNDIQLLCIYYKQKQQIYDHIKHKFGKDIAIEIMKFVMPKWKLSLKFQRLSEPERIQSNISQYNVFKKIDEPYQELNALNSGKAQKFDYGC